MNRTVQGCLTRALFIGICGSCPTIAAAGWTVTDLAPLSQDRAATSIAYAINNGGLVAGQSSSGSYTFAALWDVNGVGGIGGGGPSTYALAVNDRAQFTGNYYLGFSTQKNHAFFSDAGRLFDIGTFGGYRSVGRSINDDGIVVGEADLADNTTSHAFSWQTGKLTDLGTLGGAYSGALGVNSTGWITGYSQLVSGEDRAFFWSERIGMVDIGTLGGGSAAGYGINNSGQIVGYADLLGSGRHAFLWDQGHGMQDLGTLGGSWSMGYGINSSGQIVGGSTTADGSAHLFLYSDGVMTDLTPFVTGFTSLDYTHLAINDRGQIVGSGIVENGREHGFLLTPTATVPEPASWTLLLIAFMSMLLRRETFRPHKVALVIANSKRLLGFIALFAIGLCGASGATISQSFSSDWTVSTWNYYGDVAAIQWHYIPYTPFDPSIGSLQAVKMTTTISGIKSDAEDLAVRYSFFTGWSPDQFQFYDTIKVGSGSSTFLETRSYQSGIDFALTNFLNNLYLPQANYYFESRTKTEHSISAQTVLTYEYAAVNDVPEPQSIALIAMALIGLSVVRRRVASRCVLH